MSDAKQQIIQNIKRFLELRRFKQDPVFNARLEAVQQWQHQRMNHTYQRLLHQENERLLMTFFLEEVYGGIDPSGIASKLETAIKVADKLFSNLNLINIAFEFNAITGELDESMAQQLFEMSQCDEITEKHYVEALKDLKNQEKRLLQADLIWQFAHGLDEIVTDKSIYRAFKLGKYPAKMGGLGSLYQLMDKGFNAMLSLENSESLIKKVVNHERQCYQNIYQNSGNTTNSNEPLFPVF